MVAGDVAAVVIAGAGGDFCAGGDLGELVSSDLEAAGRHIEETIRLPALIEAVPRPVVAAVDGFALGTGFEVAVAADAAVATERAAFGRAPGIVGRGLARNLVLRGRRRLSGADAHRLGLVCELHPPERLLDAAVALAAELAASPQFLRTKRLLARGADETYRLAPVVGSPLLLSERARATRDRFARG